MNGDLIIRTDVNTFIGTGHLMRCLALAQAWKARRGRVIFIMACESQTIRQHLKDEGFKVILLEEAYPNSVDCFSSLIF